MYENLECCPHRREHPVWRAPRPVSAPSTLLRPDGAELADVRARLACALATPVGTERRVDAVRELGEAVLRHCGGPGSLIYLRPGWRILLLNKFACFRHELDRTCGRLYKNPEGCEPISAAARRRFRAVARAVIAALNTRKKEDH